MMRLRRSVAGGAMALALCFAQSALAQDAEDDAAEAPAAEAPAKAEAPPAEPPPKSDKPARRPARTATPPKSAAPPAKSAAPAQTTPPAATTPSGKTAVTAQDVRPPANILLDCAKAPADAVTKLPDDLARWATVYCTKLGHIFNANDRFFGAFPDSGARASISAAEMTGKGGEPGHSAYFTRIGYVQLKPDEVRDLIARDPSVRRILENKPLWRLDLTASGGQSLTFVAINPGADPFWVFPLNEKGIATPAFYVTSLDTLNKVR